MRPNGNTKYLLLIITLFYINDLQVDSSYVKPPENLKVDQFEHKTSYRQRIDNLFYGFTGWIMPFVGLALFIKLIRVVKSTIKDGREAIPKLMSWLFAIVVYIMLYKQIESWVTTKSFLY